MNGFAREGYPGNSTARLIVHEPRPGYWRWTVRVEWVTDLGNNYGQNVTYRTRKLARDRIAELRAP